MNDNNMDKEYIDRDAALRAILGQPPDAHYPGWYADSIKEIPAAYVVPVVHGDIERERIEAILKKHGTYILSTIDGRGCHVGCYKGIALDADADWIIEAEVESMSETNCGDFIPVVHGEWINCNGGNATCSHCKTRQKNVYDDENEQRFCGHCGAKMDGGKK